MKCRWPLPALLVAIAFSAGAQKQTVCTITVNSPDEREVFREHLPADKFDFVELVERGRPDWLAASCRKGIRCDMLLVSGHFAGTEFYSSRFHVEETLPVDEVERVACSDSCPGLFSELKEVYLFGCDTLNPTPIRTVTPEVTRSLVRDGESPADAARIARELGERHGESALAHMRRLFPDVPVIYGFSSKAPYGKYAGPMLRKLFVSGGAGDIGSGRVSEKLHRLFAPASMTVTTGLRATDAHADFRAEACRFHDDRLTAARKLAEIHATMARSMAATRLSLERIEKFMATVPAAERQSPAFVAALAGIARDEAVRARYLALVRDTADPAVRVRLVTLAQSLGWLDEPGRRAELVHMVGDMLSTRAAGFGEVDLICNLNREGQLEQELHRLGGFALTGGRAADAALACLGSADSRSRILAALASRDEREVQLAQAYLRHRPITDAAELRNVALDVARMEPSGAQARALETLARQRIADEEVLAELSRLFARSTSLAVQRAIAEVFLRAGYRGAGELAPLVKRHRLRSPDGPDIIDTLLARL